MAFYKRFYLLNKVIGSDKFFCQVGTIIRKYWGTRKIIAIQTINNFIVHKLLNPCIEVISKMFCYHTINN